MARATWFCVDIECSGPVPGRYDMLSLGVVQVAQDHHNALHIGQSLYLEIKPQSSRVDAAAMAVHGLDLGTLREHGLPLPQAMVRLSAFVQEHTTPGSKPVFVGHNAPFDWSFVHYAYVSSNLPNPFGYKALDTKALAMGVLGVHWFDTHKAHLQAELGLPVPDKTKVHRADYDAWYQAHILVGLLHRRRSCVDS